MMVIKINDKEYTLEFSFNSFKHMDEFDLEDIKNLERKPFKMIPIAETLLKGAIHNKPYIKVSDKDIDQFLEQYISNGNSIGELLEQLMELLEKSEFFKKLQGMPQPEQEVQE